MYEVWPTPPLQEWSVVGPPPDRGQRSECNWTQGQGRRWGVLSEPSYSHHYHHARLCLQPPHEEVSRPPQQQHSIACMCSLYSVYSSDTASIIGMFIVKIIIVSILFYNAVTMCLHCNLSLTTSLSPPAAWAPPSGSRWITPSLTSNWSANTQTLPNLPLFICLKYRLLWRFVHWNVSPYTIAYTVYVVFSYDYNYYSTKMSVYHYYVIIV